MASGKKIVLYGAGQKAHTMRWALEYCGYEVVFCVVTNDVDENAYFEDLRVFSINSKIEQIKRAGYLIVIATFLRYEDGIEKSLQEKGLNNYWASRDLPWRIDVALYEKFYLSDVGLKSKDDCAKEEKVITIVKKIICVVLIMNPRAFKIVQSLKKAGMEVTCLVWIEAYAVCNEKLAELSGMCDYCKVCTSVDELLEYCKMSNADVLHVFSEANSSIDLAQVLIMVKKGVPKVVFDEYDVVTEMYREVPQQTKDIELFCLEHADGICHRGTEVDYLSEQGYDVCRKRIHFMDYCGDNHYYESPQKAYENALELVYVGGLLAGKAYEEVRVNRILDFANLCQQNNCHLHVYPSSYDRVKMHEYVEMEKQNPYFHLHEPVPYERLCEEISKYDYGVFPAKKDFLEYAEQHGNYTKAQNIHSTTNKKFDYIEAGLPIITATQVAESKVFEEEGILIRKTDEELDFDELRARRNEMKRNVVAVREKYRISNQIGRLIEFYNSL